MAKQESSVDTYPPYSRNGNSAYGPDVHVEAGDTKGGSARRSNPRTQGASFAPDTEATSESDISLVSIWRTLLRRKWVVLPILLLSLIAGIVLALQPRRFVGSGSLQVRSGSADRYKVAVSQLTGGGDSDDRIESEVAILQSKALYTKVAEDLHLASNPAVAGRYAAPHASMQDPGVQARVITAMRKMILVQRTPKTQIITIDCSSTSPLLSSQIVNTLMNEYIERIFTTRFGSTQRAAKYLATQLDDLKNQVLSDQQQLVDLQGKLGVIGFDDTHNLVTSQLEDLARANQQANIERITAEARYRILQDEKLDLVDGGPAMLSQSSQPTGGSLLQTLRSTRAQVATQYANVTEQFGPNYPEARRLKSQLAEATAQVGAEESRVLEQAKVSYTAALRNQRMTNDALAQQRDQAFGKRNDMVAYQLLLHDYQASRTLYEGLMQHLREAGVTSGLESSEIETIDLATLPVTPTGYGPLEFVAICLAIGVVTAVFAAMLVQSLDTSVHSADDLEAFVRMPLLAILPSFAVDPGRRTLGESATTTAGQVLEVLRAPQSHFSEGIRLLRTSLLLSRAESRPRLILFTSSMAGEGKSTVSSNEACLLAQNGARVLLIDADLRRPSQHTRFGLANGTGLSTYLSGGGELRNFISAVEGVPTLFVLPSGPLPPSPGELLGSSAMHRLLEDAAETYDFVLIDTPPSLTIADSALLADRVDTIVLVVRAGVANKKMVLRTRNTLLRVHGNLSGFVFNGLDKSSAEYYEYKQYDNAYAR